MKGSDHRFGLDDDPDDLDDPIPDNLSFTDLLAADPTTLELRDWSRRTSSADGDHLVSSPSYDKFSWNRLFVFMGPGFLVSTSFLDPGNFDTDIQAGAKFEYELVWVLISATMLGLLLQNLAAKLGVITGLNLAEICAQQYPGRLKYILWVLAEITIIASDIPEVIGTAFALRFLFKFPLWLGVIVTSASVMMFLMVNLFGHRKLEILIASMIGIVALCFVGELLLSSVQTFKLIRGVVPTFNLAGIYTATSLIGSVVMPHNIFLHSALVQSRPIRRTMPALREACFYNFIESFIALSIALFINISILAMSAAEFYPDEEAGLLSAPSLLQKILRGPLAPTLFSVALLASGQSSTMTGTYAGQFVMEGFIQLKMPKWSRAVITRLLAIMPSLIIALIAGEKGADDLIILSQVILSLLLPFSLIPLLKFTSCPHKMGSFVNGTATKTVITILGAGVTFANCMMVGGEIVPLLGNLSGIVSVLGTLLVASVAIAYLALLGHLLITPISITHLPLDIKPS